MLVPLVATRLKPNGDLGGDTSSEVKNGLQPRELQPIDS
jgi:hypothetical protein